MVVLSVILAAAAAVPTPTPTPLPAARMGGSGGITKASQPSLRGRSLGEVARGVKLRFPAHKPQVITNESLKQLGSGVELTTGSPAPTPASGEAFSSEEQQQAKKKAYWQERYFSARQELTNLEAEEKRLTAEAARLEREFYSRDDPAQRDNVIKPAWDDAVAKLREVQQRLEASRSAPEGIANEARRDGALPGWFRETPAATPAPQGRQ